VIGQIVLASCFLIGSIILATGLGITAWRIWALHKFLISTSSRVDLTTLPNLVEVTTKYHEGVLAMGEAQVAATKDLEAGISRFADLMFAGNSSTGFQEHDERRADAEFEVQNLMRNHHIPEDEARDRVKEKNLYSKLNVTR
jgi:hypothetical protein